MQYLVVASKWLMAEDMAFDKFESLIDLLDSCGAIVPSDKYRNHA